MSEFTATGSQAEQRQADQQRSAVSQRRKGHRHAMLAAALLMLTVAGLILVGLSPIALRSLANIRGVDWAKLSNVGQAYGTVSALLVVLGLSGVAVTMLMQVRESRHSRVQAARSRQHDLVRMAMDDPLYMSVMAPGGDFDERRQASYVNLWLQFWLMLWDFGDLSEAELRNVLAAELFSSTAGRRSWERFRGVRIRDSERRQHRRFYDILDQEYLLAASDAAHAGMAAPSEEGSGHLVTVVVWTIAATAVSAILRWALRNPWAARPSSGRIPDMRLLRCRHPSQ